MLFLNKTNSEFGKLYLLISADSLIENRRGHVEPYEDSLENSEFEYVYYFSSVTYPRNYVVFLSDLGALIFVTLWLRFV